MTEYSTEQIKSIFTLIKEASYYAYPLLFSLLFPFVWIVLKKFLGVSEIKEEVAVDPQQHWTRRALKKLKRWFTIQGNRGDRCVFMLSIGLFISGGIFLKWGEYQEELIRQDALALKTYFKVNNAIAIAQDVNFTKNFSKERIDKICYAYPDEFIVVPPLPTDSTVTSISQIAGNLHPAPSDSDRTNCHFAPTVRCVDSLFYEQYKQRVFPLLDAFLAQSLRNNRSVIYFDQIFLGTQPVRRMFMDEIVYDYLALAQNKTKYIIYAYDQGRSCIMLR